MAPEKAFVTVVVVGCDSPQSRKHFGMSGLGRETRNERGGGRPISMEDREWSVDHSWLEEKKYIKLEFGWSCGEVRSWPISQKITHPQPRRMADRNFGREARSLLHLGRRQVGIWNGTLLSQRRDNVFDRDMDQPLLPDQLGCNIICRTQRAPPSSLTL